MSEPARTAAPRSAAAPAPATRAAGAPAARLIPIRRPGFELGPEVPRHWCRGEPFATHVLNALSSVFPAGESFFVRSVMHYVREIEDDPELLADVRAFAGQEGRHSLEHDGHIDLLVAQGYGALETRNRLVDKMLRWSNRNAPAASLAGTAAVEHLTALLARVVLDDGPRTVDDMDPRMADLWQWHALEEAEHKAVAYDVLMRVHPSYGLRVYALATNTLAMFVETLDRVVYMLWKDGELFRWKTWRDGWRFLFASGKGVSGERGILRGLGPDYWSWYRRDFHPDDVDDSARIAKYRARYADAVAR